MNYRPPSIKPSDVYGHARKDAVLRMIAQYELVGFRPATLRETYICPAYLNTVQLAICIEEIGEPRFILDTTSYIPFGSVWE